jgi:hypothetical protein
MQTKQYSNALPEKVGSSPEVQKAQQKTTKTQCEPLSITGRDLARQM